MSNLKVFNPSGLFGGREYEPAILQEATQCIQDGAQGILIDFSAVTFVDSMGVSVLVRLLQRCNKAKCQLYLCAMNESARMIMELTEIYKNFSIYPNRAAAEWAFHDQFPPA
ncbi:STAS domain-containing protein [Synechococcales cyanobacterium C]|uniref:STAS domain-containing protein n=1 Tax=Petrachloros mirabilis ULC683 TaxID=2781853 RepID=A0A8K2A8Z1_9CYAN|nr:STAS domain-containing protein [Petrachloros mirabilis]NCJ08554.1 STAS domain-containing protein [Petrachloros mirabilis ULC683]